jgi:hypothetical protein
MMTVLMLFSIVMIGLVLNSVRREHIRVEYSVSWLTASVILLILSIRPDLVSWLAGVMGVTYPPVAVLLIVVFVFLVVAYRFSLRISSLKDANIALAQRVAILEYQIKALPHEQKTATN